jgi:hypothetical protein
MIKNLWGSMETKPGCANGSYSADRRGELYTDKTAFNSALCPLSEFWQESMCANGNPTGALGRAWDFIN